MTPMTRIVADERLSATIRPIRSNPRPKPLELALESFLTSSEDLFCQRVGGAGPSLRSEGPVPWMKSPSGFSAKSV
jgi:hypothetical protein